MADWAEIEGAAGGGNETTPALADCTYRRFRLPPTQRRPSPKISGVTRSTLPCSRMLELFGNSPELVSTSVSGVVVPAALSRAPETFCEFAQPRPAAPVLLHGQAAGPLPSPKQNGKPTPDSHSSGMPFEFVSWLAPPAMSQLSGTPLRLQSGAPAAISQASPTWSWL